MAVPISAEFLQMLRCPVTGLPLRQTSDGLESANGSRKYALTASGIPLFGEAGLSAEAIVQQQHYERIATRYAENLSLEHTREYFAYLDKRLLALVAAARLDRVAEICCGAGEAFHLLGRRARLGVGVDVSTSMLEQARTAVPGETRLFVQGDAVRLPLADGAFDAVFLLGGIHHVNDRASLFAEVRRILEPGGRLFWREPVDDFLPWRVARRVIYRQSATLQEDTEHPLRREATMTQLTRAGFTVRDWETVGFLGYCVLMNGDVLPITRLWAHLPGARSIARLATRLDEAILTIPGFRGAGAIAIGQAIRSSLA